MTKGAVTAHTRRVQQHEIDIFKSRSFVQALFNIFLCAFVADVLWWDFSRVEDLFARDARVDERFHAFGFVLVDCRRVDVSVAVLQRVTDGIVGFTGGCFVYLGCR